MYNSISFIYSYILSKIEDLFFKKNDFPNGIPPLNEDGLVDPIYLPDPVTSLEWDSIASKPQTIEEIDTILNQVKDNIFKLSYFTATSVQNFEYANSDFNALLERMWSDHQRLESLQYRVNALPTGGGSTGIPEEVKTNMRFLKNPNITFNNNGLQKFETLLINGNHNLFDIFDFDIDLVYNTTPFKQYYFSGNDSQEYFINILFRTGDQYYTKNKSIEISLINPNNTVLNIAAFIWGEEYDQDSNLQQKWMPIILCKLPASENSLPGSITYENYYNSQTNNIYLDPEFNKFMTVGNDIIWDVSSIYSHTPKILRLSFDQTQSKFTKLKITSRVSSYGLTEINPSDLTNGDLASVTYSIHGIFQFETFNNVDKVWEVLNPT